MMTHMYGLAGCVYGLSQVAQVAGVLGRAGLGGRGHVHTVCHHHRQPYVVSHRAESPLCLLVMVCTIYIFIRAHY